MNPLLLEGIDSELEGVQVSADVYRQPKLAAEGKLCQEGVRGSRV